MHSVVQSVVGKDRITLILPSLQGVYVYQRRLLTPSRLSTILFPLFALSPAPAIIARTVGGIFYLHSIHLDSLFILAGDSVGVAW